MSLPHSETAVTYDLAALNQEFAVLDFQDRITRLYEYFPVQQVLFTSSFGTKSVVMLTLVSRANAAQKLDRRATDDMGSSAASSSSRDNCILINRISNKNP